MSNLATDISRCLFVDFETIETDQQRIIDYLDATLTHPGTMTKIETIETWRVEKRPDALAELVAKTSLDGGYGRLASIAFAIGDAKVVSATSAKAAAGDVPAGYDPDLERKLITRFFAAWQRFCDDNGGRAPTLVGHNIGGFDIRWMWKRSIVLGIQPPATWPIDAKPWESQRVFDTMVAWEGVGGRISQDRLALALDLPTKEGFDGSMVGAAWKNGDFERIRQYNAADVETVRSIWKKIVGYAEPAVAVAETKTERDAAIDEAVRVSQNGGATVPPALETEACDVGHQTLDRPIRTGVGFRHGRAAQTGAAA